MKCPIDNTQLVMTDRQGVEIDYCPTCRGVWLDRGELDKIIERSVPAMDAPEPRYAEPRRDDKRRFDDDDDYRHRGKRKKSILSEIFDF